LNIKCKYQDSRDLGAINADDEAVESPLYNNRVDDNFNLNGSAYINARNYPVPNNVSNTPVNVYKLWKVIVFTVIKENFSFV